MEGAIKQKLGEDHGGPLEEDGEIVVAPEILNIEHFGNLPPNGISKGGEDGGAERNHQKRNQLRE